MRTLTTAITISFLATAAAAPSFGEDAAGHRPTLKIAATIPLGEVGGRIDHLAIDIKRNRLFVAELGNSSLGVVDLTAGTASQALKGIGEPQGVAMVPAADLVAVTSGAEGTLHILKGEDLSPVTTIAIGSDADNVRLHPDGVHLLVGYGDGVAVVDPAGTAAPVLIPLDGHAEGFQIEPDGKQAVVNVPETRSMSVIDLAAGQVAAKWAVEDDGANFPMALAAGGKLALAVFRSPSSLGAFSVPDGGRQVRLPVCDDADDVFVDARRSRVYVVCGEGFVDVVDVKGDEFTRVDHIRTAPRARTGLFVPELDRLFIAAPATGDDPARVLVLEPAA